MGDVRKLVELDYPARLVTEPVLSRLIRKYGIDINIRRASTTRSFGYVQCELSGEDKAVQAAVDDLLQQGIAVKPILKDVVE